MYKAECRTERYHIKVGIALREQAALQTSMDATNNGLLAKQLDIRLLDNALQVAMTAHLPSGIAIARLCLSTSQLESSTDSGTHIVEV